MNKKIFASLAVLCMVFCSFQLAQPVSATTTVIDSGTKYFTSGQSGPMKIDWKTYRFSNTNVRAFVNVYVKSGGKYVISWHEVNTITKPSKSIIRINEWTDSELSPGPHVRYVKSNINPAPYYWVYYRKQMISG